MQVVKKGRAKSECARFGCVGAGDGGCANLILRRCDWPTTFRT